MKRIEEQLTAETLARAVMWMLAITFVVGLLTIAAASYLVEPEEREEENGKQYQHISDTGR